MLNIFSINKKKENNKFGPPHAVLNLSKIGLRYFRIGMNVSPESKEKLAVQLSSHPNVGWVLSGEGYFNFAIGVWAKDNAEINDVSQQVRSILSKDDEIVFQSELTSLYSFGNRPATGNGNPMCIVDATTNVILLSPLEVDYIKLLALDSSIDKNELIQILNIDYDHLLEIDKHLTDTGVVVGYQERIEYEGVYFKVFVDSLSRKTKSAESDLIKTLWDDNSCIYFERANSKYDLEFELVLQSKSDLKEYLKDFSEYKIGIITKNIYTNLYPVNKVANLKEIKDTLLHKNGNVVDFRNSKFWYMNYLGAKEYLDVYSGNKKYFETMEKGELDLFDDISQFVNSKYKGNLFNIIDIGSGNGFKGKVFIEKLNEKMVKSYYPVDIQPIELAVALNNHNKSEYAKHPTLLDIENLSARFPLKMSPNEKQIYIFFGGTYGNFKQEEINSYLKPLINETSSLLISMPIVGENRTDEEIINSYSGAKFDAIMFGPISQAGFKRSDFEVNEKFKDMVVRFNMEEGRCLVSSAILKNEVNVSGQHFDEGTIFKVSTSWKPTLKEFKDALEKDFVIEKIFNNKEMAIALIEYIK